MLRLKWLLINVNNNLINNLLFQTENLVLFIKRLLIIGVFYACYILFFCFLLKFIFKVCNLQKEIKRKCLHLVAFTSLFFLVLLTNVWQISAIITFLVLIVTYPVFSLLEKCNFYNELNVERKKGEIKKSIFIFYLIHTLLICLFWGLLDSKLTIIIQLLVWGFGDLISALIGKKYGKHKFKFKLADSNKSYEGSFSMFILTLILTTVTMLLFRYDLAISLCIATLTTLSATFVELISKDGSDTITVPLITSLVFYLATIILL